MMVRPAALGFALVVLAACGGRFAGETPGDLGPVDSGPAVDASRAEDAAEAHDGIAPEAAPDGNAQDAQASLCPSGETTCADIDLCVKQIAASPPQGVLAITGWASAVDYLRSLAGPSLQQFKAGAGEFVGADGHPYAFASVPGDVWVVVNGDVAPAVYKLVVQYIQCGCSQGQCEPQDGAAGD
jgi:hypothetical protein